MTFGRFKWRQGSALTAGLFRNKKNILKWINKARYWWALFIFLCSGVEDMWCVVNTIVSWLWHCLEERQRAPKWTVSSGLSSISCVGALNIQCFCIVDDMMAGKRFYMTASVAREHTNKLWENEGTTLNITKQDVKGRTHHVRLPHACLWEEFFIIIIHLSSSSLNCHYRLFFEVSVFWSRGNSVTAGRTTFQPLFHGNAGGSTMQVLAFSQWRWKILWMRILEHWGHLVTSPYLL